MNIAQRGGTIPDSKQGTMGMHGRTVDEVAEKIDAFTQKYLVRAISVTMVYVPMVPASAFQANAIFAPTVAEGEAADKPETEGLGPFHAVVIFEEERTMIEPTDEMMTAAYEAYRQYGRTECEPDFDEALLEAITAALDKQPQAMVPVKLTLSNSDEEDAERILGTFNQGVYIDKFDRTAPVTVYDLAGWPTRNAIARYFADIGYWMIEGEDNADMVYSRLHVQAVALAVNEIQLSERVAHDAARIRGFRPSDHTPHDTVGEIYDAAHKLGTEDIEVVVRPRRRVL